MDPEIRIWEKCYQSRSGPNSALRAQTCSGGRRIRDSDRDLALQPEFCRCPVRGVDSAVVPGLRTAPCIGPEQFHSCCQGVFEFAEIMCVESSGARILCYPTSIAGSHCQKAGNSIALAEARRLPVCCSTTSYRTETPEAEFWLRKSFYVSVCRLCKKW